MSAAAAKDYGLIDDVLTERSALPAIVNRNLL
jgi:ATP-dependent protease ClpP protease subunit